MARSRWFPVLLCIAAFCPGLALAQASAYAGTWGGTTVDFSTTTCTCSGACGSIPTNSTTCNGTSAWSGTVDSQGNFTLTQGAGTDTCNGSSNTLAPSPPEFIGTISSSGILTVPGSSDTMPAGSGTVTETCPAFTVQFSLSPPSVSGSSSCSGSGSSSGGGFTISCTNSSHDTISGTRLTAAPAPPKPIFPITVSSNINPVSATATAQVQPPAQVVGTTASVYVFAHARLSALGHAATKRTAPIDHLDGTGPDPCVLAQLNSNGQLVAVSGSSLQAYTTSVISSQTQAVSILNNVPTPNVAGASFLVGYGTTSTAMLNGGVYEGAVSVPGSSACSAALLTGAAPNSPSALSGLWWGGASESGWGVSFSQRRNIVFAAWYTYDAAGNPKWYVAPSCPLPSGNTGTSGTCTGALYQVTGPTFFGTPFDASLKNVAAVGSLTVNFQNANAATMTYTVNGQGRTIPISRQVFGAGTTPPAVDYTDLWWNPSEDGWGLVASQQFGVTFLAWYVYDSTGKPIWYVAPNCSVVGSSCSGTLYRTTGPALGPTFDPTAVHAFEAGTVNVSFSDANNATLSYTVGSVTSTKTITRQVF